MVTPLSDWDFGARYYGYGNKTAQSKSEPIVKLPEIVNVLPSVNPLMDGMDFIDTFTDAATTEKSEVEIGEDTKAFAGGLLGGVGSMIGEWLPRGVVVILGFIFVAGGLLLFPKAQMIVKAATK